jgi:hypothetical protein
MECVPFISALTEPSVFLAGRPAADRAAYSWAGWFVALVLISFVINNNRRVVVRKGAHVPHYDLIRVSFHSRLPQQRFGIEGAEGWTSAGETIVRPLGP